MGKIKNNVVKKGFSGQFGEDFVSRQGVNEAFLFIAILKQSAG